MTTREKAAVLYLRVSTQEQAIEGISLAAQEAKLRTYCGLRELAVAEVICEAGVSGGKALQTRDGGQRVLELIKRRTVSHVVAYKLDRLFRSAADCLTVTAEWDKRGIALHLVDLGGQTLDTSSAMGRFFLTVMAGAAELERNLVSERTRDGLAHKRSMGQRTGLHARYGQRIAEDGKTLVADEREQQLLCIVQGYRQSGMSQRAIVTRLEADGFTTRRGTALGLRQVQRIMEQASVG